MVPCHHVTISHLTMCPDATRYNQLAPMLAASGAGGDVPTPDGTSAYPGNLNALIFALPPYTAALQLTGGVMPEFVNPKYADAARLTFKKPTRLECMMQDLPKLLPPTAAVGFTAFDRWCACASRTRTPARPHTHPHTRTRAHPHTRTLSPPPHHHSASILHPSLTTGWPSHL
jgi:hypothetical protein